MVRVRLFLGANLFSAAHPGSLAFLKKQGWERSGGSKANSRRMYRSTNGQDDSCVLYVRCPLRQTGGCQTKTNDDAEKTDPVDDDDDDDAHHKRPTALSSLSPLSLSLSLSPLGGFGEEALRLQKRERRGVVRQQMALYLLLAHDEKRLSQPNDKNTHSTDRSCSTHSTAHDRTGQHAQEKEP